MKKIQSALEKIKAADKIQESMAGGSKIVKRNIETLCKGITDRNWPNWQQR